jgi:hypothetical protein
MIFTDELRQINNIEKAYIQMYKGDFANEATYNAFMGCEFLKIPTKKFDYDDIGLLEITKNTIVLGGINAVLRGMQIAGLEILPKPLDVPKELYPYTKRTIRIGTIKSLMEENKFPIFVKPRIAKLFTGTIVCSADELEMFRFLHTDDLEMEIMSSDIVKFVSEYRTFIIDGHIYDCRKYSGNHRIFPDFNFIDETIKAYKSAPISYGIDFGITDKGETMLIEANDGYSLGTYGFDCYNYVRMCILRWNQLLNNEQFIKKTSS